MDFKDELKMINEILKRINCIKQDMPLKRSIIKLTKSVLVIEAKYMKQTLL